MYYFRFFFLWDSKGKNNRKINTERFYDQSHSDFDPFDDEWLMVKEVL